MPATRIDFKYIREHADFEKVLAHFGVDLTKDGSKHGQFKALCPFHDDVKPSLKINLERKIFNCFACDASGNVLDFVADMDEIELRPAAQKVAELSGCALSAGRQGKQRAGQRHDRKGRSEPAKSDVDEKDTAPPPAAADKQSVKEPERTFNPPLTFTLKNLDTEHPFFEERGLTPKMIEAFGLGIATRGIMKGRLVFPIHGQDGKLVAYCGRWVEGELPENEPKYKFPAGFRKELEFFSCDPAKKSWGETIIVVESFLSVVKLEAYDYDVVSPMGRSLSAQQIEVLKSMKPKHVLLLFDGDDPGRQAVVTVGRQLLAEGFEVKAPVVAEDFKPHRCDQAELDTLLEEYR